MTFNYSSAAVLLTLLLVASGCDSPAPGVTSDARADGPLHTGGAVGKVCLPSSPDGQYTFGFDVLRNKGPEPVTITGVDLVDATDVDVVEAFVVAVPDRNLVGVSAGWPPDVDQPGWEARAEAAVVELPGDDADWNLVLHLEAEPAPESTYAAVRIRYTVEGETDRFTAQNTTGLIIRETC